MLETSTGLGATAMTDSAFRSPCSTFEMASHGACQAVQCSAPRHDAGLRRFTPHRKALEHRPPRVVIQGSCCRV
eukprot:3196054-Prymnesium_polylepis.1